MSQSNETAAQQTGSTNGTSYSGEPHLSIKQSGFSITPIRKSVMSESPSTVQFNNQLLCFFQGLGDSGDLCFVKSSDGGESWTEKIVIETGVMSCSPSAIVYNNAILCFFQGVGPSGDLWCVSSPDGNAWSEKQLVANSIMSQSPNVMIYNKQLYCFYQYYGQHGDLYYSILS